MQLGICAEKYCLCDEVGICESFQHFEYVKDVVYTGLKLMHECLIKDRQPSIHRRRAKVFLKIIGSVRCEWVHSLGNKFPINSKEFLSGFIFRQMALQRGGAGFFLLLLSQFVNNSGEKNRDPVQSNAIRFARFPLQKDFFWP